MYTIKTIIKNDGYLCIFILGGKAAVRMYAQEEGGLKMYELQQGGGGVKSWSLLRV